MVAIFTGVGTGLERGSANVIGALGLLGSSTLGRSGNQALLNAATGNLVITGRDEFLVGRGLDVGIQRTYNSQGNFTDDNGDNWRQSTDRVVFGLTGTANTAGSTVKRRSADGSEITYTWNSASAAYIATDGAGAYDKLTYNSGASSWTWTDGDSQVTESYAAYGSLWRITQQADTSGNVLSFSYTGANLALVTTANGEYVQYSWSGNNITQIVTGYTDYSTSTAKTLTRTRYGYDSYNRLTTVTTDLSPEDNSVTDGKTYVVTYGYQGTTKLVNSITETDGTSLVIGYDGSNRVTSLTQTVVSGVTRLTTITYNAGATQITDPLNQVTTLNYDANGALTGIVAPPAYTGATAQTVSFGYNGNGDLTSVTDALGHTTTYTYDANGNQLTATDRLGNVVTRTYGANNVLLTETHTASDTGGSANSQTVRFVYDSASRLRYTISAEGEVNEIQYNSFGQVSATLSWTSKYDVSGLSSSTALTLSQLTNWSAALSDKSYNYHYFEYDGRGDQTLDRNVGYDVNGNPLYYVSYSDSFTTYNQSGQLLNSHLATQNTQYYVYDGLGRVVAATDKNGASTSFVFQDSQSKTVVTLASGLVQTSTYNKAGELIAYTESGSYVTSGSGASNAYDADGRLRKTTDAVGASFYHLYDNAGRLTADIDSSGTLVEYRYDQNSRLIATARYLNLISSTALTQVADPASTVKVADIRPAANANDLWSWTIYDNEGRVTQTIDGDGSVSALQYDAAGQLIKTTAYKNRLTGTQLSTFKTTPPTAQVLPATDAGDAVSRVFYDKDGRQVGTLDALGYLTQTQYDSQGHVIRTVAYANATSASYRASGTYAQLLNSATPSANDRSARFIYDQRGFLRYQIDAQNHVVELGYVEGTTTYSAIGLVRTQTAYAATLGTLSDYNYATVKAAVDALANASNDRTSYSVYDSAGLLRFTVDALGGVTRLDYDTAGRLIKTKQFANTRPTTSLPTYGDLDSWAGSHVDSKDRITRNYYNARDQLVYSVDPEGYVSGFDYDADGRVTAQYRWATPIAAYDTSTISDIASSVASLTRTSATTYYDADGRVIDTYDALGIRTHNDYLATGQLLATTVAYGTADATTIRFAYDPAGYQVSQTSAYGTSAAVTTSAEYDGLGNLVRQIDGKGNSTYYYYNQLGQRTTVRDAENYVTEFSYNSFGELTTTTRRANAATNAASTTSLPVYAASASADAITSLTYDQLGQVTRSTDALGNFESYGYDAFGQRITSTNKLGGVTTSSFDKLGRLVSETSDLGAFDGTGAIVLSSVTTQYTYDAFGSLLTTVEAPDWAEQRTTWFEYDRLGRLTRRYGEGVTALSQTDFLNATVVTPSVSYQYDSRGNVILTTDPLGAKTYSYYDADNRLIVQVGPAGTYSSYSYDNRGDLISSREYDTAVALPGSPGGTPPAAPGGGYRETVNVYDKLGRVTSSQQTGILNGKWNSASNTYTTATTNPTVSYVYDANGNVLTATDALGAVTYSYYDKDNRKTAQVDAGGYLTTWAYDADGNVTTERRYATRYTGTPTTSAPPSLSTSADDRVTTFTYDVLGQRLTEKRSGVVAWAISSTGTLSQAATDAIITYTYTKTGQVKTKTEANGDTTTYDYDVAGRLLKESRTSYQDQDGNTVTPTLRYSYDRLGNLVQTRQGGAAYGASDRITTNSYRNDGLLSTVTDAAGNVTTYGYDAAGNVVLVRNDRTNSSGTGFVEATLTTRDQLGRETSSARATWNGTAWVKGVVQSQTYNAHGETATRGTNVDAGHPAQESFIYDAAGRLAGSNTGDGVWRYYLYDANGNQTAVIESEGADLSNKTLAQAISAATNNGAATLGASFIDGINVSFTLYDARNQAVQSLLPQRELSGTAAKVTLKTSRAYNAFGEVLWEKDARQSENTTTTDQTDYLYNTLGRVIQVTSPQVASTSSNGTVSQVRPVVQLRYDLSGRLIASVDANGNLTRQYLLAGTGHGETAALTAKEFHADGGVVENSYDVFGDLRRNRNELYAQYGSSFSDELSSYDALGRVTQITHRGGLIDYYAYDQLGQRIKHWNSFLTSSNVEKTDYDLQGRIVAQVAFGGDTTTTAYQWNAGTTNSGFAGTTVIGGWTQTTTYQNGKTLVEVSDIYGHELTKTDLGGHVFSFTYDRAGRLTSRSGNGETATYNWLNNGQVGSLSTVWNYNTLAQTSSYDRNGNKLSELQTRTVEYYDYYEDTWAEDVYNIENATATYDALNRLVTWTEVGSDVTAPAATLSYEYDNNSNVRRTLAQYRLIDNQGVVSTYSVPQDRWYAYDALNRMVVAEGALVSGVIARGSSGTSISYDQAGRRISASHDETLQAQIQNQDFGDGINKNPYIYVQYNGEVREDYTYQADGTLSSVRIAKSGYEDNFDGTITVNGPPATGALSASFTYDSLGRITHQTDWLGDGTNASYDRLVTYNAKGQITFDSVSTKQGSDIYRDDTTYSYTDGNGQYLLGSVARTDVGKYKNGSDSAVPDPNTVYSYAWYDGAVQSAVAYKPVWNQSTTYTTTNTLSSTGITVSSYIGDGRPRTVSFTNDVYGQVIARDESDNNYSKGDPHQRWYRFNGREIGTVGNNGTLDLSYSQSISDRTATNGSGAFRHGSDYGSSYASFGEAYEGLNSYAQGSSGGSVTAQAGDTLAGIASRLWGDSALWYKLAEANGLSSGATLADGQVLSIPAGVSRSSNTASTFKPYDPAETLGDTSPTTPKPAKHNKCGGIGAILVAVVAIAVTAIIAPELIGHTAHFVIGEGAIGLHAVSGATGLAGVLGSTGGAIVGGGLAAAAGSLASQGVGIALGLQHNINWAGVGLAALGGAVGGAIGPNGAFGDKGLFGSKVLGSQFAADSLRGVASNVAIQGLGIATHLQTHFDWAGVAVGGVVAGTAGATNWGGFDGRLTSGTLGAISGAAARSLIDGTDFGDNVLAALPDAIGTTIGETLVAVLTSSAAPSQEPMAAQGDESANVFGGGYTLSRMRTPVAYLVDPQDAGGPAVPDGGGTGTIFVWGRRSIFNVIGDLITGIFSRAFRLSPRRPDDVTRLSIRQSMIQSKASSWISQAPTLYLPPRSAIDRYIGIGLIGPLASPKYQRAAGAGVVDTVTSTFGGGFAMLQRGANSSPIGLIGGAVDLLGVKVPDGVPNARRQFASDVGAVKALGAAYQKYSMGQGLQGLAISGGIAAAQWGQRFSRMSGEDQLATLIYGITRGSGEVVIALASDGAVEAKWAGKASGVVEDLAAAGSSAAEGADVVSYARPSGFRKGVRDQVWDNAKGSDGLVRDPVTNRVIDPSEPWDMGHLPGYEFRKHQQSAIERAIPRRQFLDEHNNPAKYRPELPSSNRSHRGEILTDDYFGD